MTATTIQTNGIFAETLDLSARFHRATVQTKMPRSSKGLKGLVGELEAKYGATQGKALKDTASKLYDEAHPFWTQVKKAKSAAVSLHTKMTSVWDGTGWRLLSTANWAEYCRTLQPLLNEFNNIADGGPALFDGFLCDAQQRLGTLFNRDLYPDNAQAFRESFSIIARCEPIPKLDDAKRLATVLPVAEIEAMQKDMERAYADNVARISAQNWEMMYDRAKKLQESLTAYARGEQKTVHQTLLDEMEKCCCFCSQFNVNGDNRLAMLIEDLRNSVTGLDMETIRKNPIVQAEVIATTTSARDKAMAEMSKMRGITGVTLN
jgi:hypothetical protein